MKQRLDRLDVVRQRTRGHYLPAEPESPRWYEGVDLDAEEWGIDRHYERGYAAWCERQEAKREGGYDADMGRLAGWWLYPVREVEAWDRFIDHQGIDRLYDERSDDAYHDRLTEGWPEYLERCGRL